MRILTVFAALVMGAQAAIAEIDIQEVTSPGGFTAWLVEEPSIPFVALELRFKGGAAAEPADQRGVTNLMIGLLEEGAGDLDARGFAEASEAIAARFSFDVADDATAISAQFLTETRDEAMALLRAALIEPRFDEASIERVRGQVLSSLRSDLKDPDQIAGRAFDTMVFGDHPYGGPANGTVESVTALTRDDIVAAHQGTLARDRVYIAAAGDISAEELGALVDALLSDLPETGFPLPQAFDVQMQGGVTVVPFDTPQSVSIFGHEGIARDDPDFFPAFVMNEIFGGGGFEARLMTEVREKRGLTYGVYSTLVPKDHAALYLGRVASANDRIAEAIEVIQDEWARLATEGVTQDELDRAKTYLTGGYPLRFDGNRPIARILVGMQLDDLPIDYVNTRNAKVEAVTLDDISRVAARILKPDSLHFVVVGQPEGLETAPGQ